MSRVKNISGGPLDVPLLGRMVEDGEVVEVPDFQPGHTDETPLPVIWPANRWEDVADEAPEPETPAGDDTEGEQS